LVLFGAFIGKVRFLMLSFSAFFRVFELVTAALSNA
jgi:hypothetical protein